MRLRATFCAVITVLASTTFAQQINPNRPSQHAEFTYASGQTLRLKINAGDFEIVPSEAGDKIVVTWQAKASHPDDVNKVTVSLKSSTLKVHGPHGHGIIGQVTIPKQMNLWIRVGAGDVRVGPFVGDKDIELHAGDLTVDVGNADDYGPVNASVRAGDVNARAFGQTKDGLFRHINLQRGGKFKLHAHVGAGDLNLVVNRPMKSGE